MKKKDYISLITNIAGDICELFRSVSNLKISKKGLELVTSYNGRTFFFLSWETRTLVCSCSLIMI